MPTFQRPGVFVNEVLTSINSQAGATADTAAAFMGASSRGPVVPTRVSSWSDYSSRFGDFSNSAYLAQAVFSFFQNGGKSAWVTRVVGTGSVSATRTYADSQGVPVNVLTVTAANAGAWGNSINIEITTGSAAGRFNLQVYYGGTALTNVVESFNDLSMATTDARYAPSVINGASLYITVIDVTTTNAGNAPANVAVGSGSSPLAGGNDGAAPGATDYNTALALLGNIGGSVVLNLPGVTDTTTLGNAITFAQNQGNVFVVIDPPANQTSAQAISYAAGLSATSYAAVYYPWIVINDPTKFTPGTTKAVPPGGAVVGQFVSSDAAVGPHKTPAGVNSRLAGAIDLQTALYPADYDSLNSASAPVNAIKPIPGYGICVFGGRTLKSGYSDKYISIRRSLIYIEQSVKDLTRYAIFQPNDGALWASLQSDVESFLHQFYNRGGLRGKSPSEAYYVKCDSTNNTLATIQNGIVNIELGVALQYPAEFIVIRVGQYEGGTTVTNTLAA